MAETVTQDLEQPVAPINLKESSPSDSTGEADGALFNSIKEVDSTDFFNQLDKEVNTAFYQDDQSTDNEETFLQEEQETPQEQVEVESNQKQEHDWEKRYKDSSRELESIKQFLPIINAMREDPKLVDYVKDYFSGGGEAPKSLKEQLGLDEDFVFDADDAFGDNDSDSAKVLNSTVDAMVRKRLREQQALVDKRKNLETKESGFRQKFEMSEEDYQEMVDWANSRKLTLEDIYYLKNRENRDDSIRKDTEENMKGQMKRMAQRPQSLSSKGSATIEEKSPDRSLFDAIQGVDSDIENIFGV